MNEITYPIFGFGTVFQTLQTFVSAADVQDTCGGLDIAEGGWLFWDASGNALEADYAEPAQIDPDRGTYKNG